MLRAGSSANKFWRQTVAMMSARSCASMVGAATTTTWASVRTASLALQQQQQQQRRLDHHLALIGLGAKSASGNSALLRGFSTAAASHLGATPKWDAQQPLDRPFSAEALASVVPGASSHAGVFPMSLVAGSAAELRHAYEAERRVDAAAAAAASPLPAVVVFLTSEQVSVRCSSSVYPFSLLNDSFDFHTYALSLLLL